jgi:hypothetical protein
MPALRLSGARLYIMILFASSLGKPFIFSVRREQRSSLTFDEFGGAKFQA